MKITVLGSRDQLCIHPDVKALENSSDKISVCREKVHRKTCLFHRNFESIQLISSSNVFFVLSMNYILVCKPDIVKLPPMDIEDLVKEGIQKKYEKKTQVSSSFRDILLCRFCPYFAARDLKEKADIIFMPYNYLLDAKVNEKTKLII